jgi:hypothetical protein
MPDTGYLVPKLLFNNPLRLSHRAAFGGPFLYISTPVSPEKGTIYPHSPAASRNRPETGQMRLWPAREPPGRGHLPDS